MVRVRISLAPGNRVGGAGHRPETLALTSRFAVAPSPARLAAIDLLIGALQQAGVWHKLDAFYVLAAHDAQAAQCNWIGAHHDLAVMGAPVFTIDRGFAGNGGDAYLETGFNPAMAGGHFQRDSASLGLWSLSDGQSAQFEMGIFQANTALGRADMRIRRENGQMAAYLNDQTFTERLAGATGKGLFSVSRLDGASRVMRHNDSFANSAAAPTLSLADGSIQILAAANFTSARSSRQCAAAWIGAGLSQEEHEAAWAGLKLYLETLGAL